MEGLLLLRSWNKSVPESKNKGETSGVQFGECSTWCWLWRTTKAFEETKMWIRVYWYCICTINGVQLFWFKWKLKSKINEKKKKKLTHKMVLFYTWRHLAEIFRVPGLDWPTNPHREDRSGPSKTQTHRLTKKFPSQVVVVPGSDSH